MKGLPRSVQFLLAVWALFAFPGHIPSAEEEKDLRELQITEKHREHWSFKPLVRAEPPEVENTARDEINPIDRFVLAKLEENGLTLMSQADRLTLLRRVTFDLTGLPPTLSEISDFRNDKSPEAYRKVVNRLLASDAYGERWAQHWLDLARFAETDGFEHDKIRPDAWRYRDWVIKALNDDLPFDRFVRMQLAGDELYPDDPDAALATGFLLSGPDMPDINLQDERRHTVLNEITSTVGSSILGLTLKCAQCHDHKSEPISQADFYRMRAFFENIVHPKRDRQMGYKVDEPGPDAPPSHLMIRGDFRRPGPELQPAFLRIVNPDNEPVPEPEIDREKLKSTGMRSVLADWVTRPDHPLMLRVIANRLWQHHLGVPLVNTPNDFGLTGGTPTHPELLDWLATELPRQDWSLKAMHRLIVHSATYKQASFGSDSTWDEALKIDPDNKLLSRMHRRRLSGETIRDAMLLTSGKLNRKEGGPGVRPPLAREITVTLLNKQWEVTEDKAEHYRRSIYLFARRNMRFPMFDAFDRPDANSSCAMRHVSTTAPQSLIMLNSEFSLEMAQHLAGRSAANHGDDLQHRILNCFESALGRPASEDEAKKSFAFVREQAQQMRDVEKLDAKELAGPIIPDDETLEFDLDPHEEAAMVLYCLGLYNLSEFVFVD